MSFKRSAIEAQRLERAGYADVRRLYDGAQRGGWRVFAVNPETGIEFEQL